MGEGTAPGQAGICSPLCPTPSGACLAKAQLQLGQLPELVFVGGRRLHGLGAGVLQSSQWGHV